MFRLKLLSPLTLGVAIATASAALLISSLALAAVTYTFAAFTGPGTPPTDTYGPVNLH